MKVATDRPIIFSAPMVRAILEGRKTQTRRVYKDQSCCPYGKPGDRLWVRETWGTPSPEDVAKKDKSEVHYRATESAFFETQKARPSIFMPRWASRITLEITSERVEPLQDISEADAMAEGALFHNGFRPRCGGIMHDPSLGMIFQRAETSFKYFWESLHGIGAWDSNPDVWVIEFKMVKGRWK